ncbi:MAG TPA: CoB--CoM heterodisulfide reductase iron-sulfur subunit B family protein [Myxococcales bacterium]
MKLGYFPGCSLHSGAKEFDLSLKAIAGPLGVELDEIKDWSCCGASSAHATDHLLAVSLAARNLSLAEAQGHQQVMAPCAACFSRLATARHEMKKDGALAKTVTPMLQRPFENSVEVLNVVAMLQNLAKDLKAKATPLAGLKVACYYGCLLVRPPEIANFDDAENPTSMEDVVSACGATPVKWAKRLDCCGAGFSLSRTGSVVRMGRAILDDAKKNGAQAVVVACPMCHSNLDLRQSAMEARGEPLGLPILFLTQLVGLALKVDPVQLGLKRHFVSAAGILQALASPAQKQLPAPQA